MATEDSNRTPSVRGSSGFDFSKQSVSSNNQSYGIWAREGTTLTCRGCNVNGNGADGVNADFGATAKFTNYFFSSGAISGNIITGNAGAGASVGDLANGSFRGSNSVSGNGQPEIACNAPTAVTRGTIAAAGGGANTNCAN